MKTSQLKSWKGKFGKSYTDRNPQTVEDINRYYKNEFGLSATELFRLALSGLKIGSVLEVGCNTGNKLAVLERIGLTNLVGLEPLEYAIKKGRKLYPKIEFRRGNAFDIPFDDGEFDLVYTAGVLIHINPNDLEKAMREAIRVSNRYILGFEYYADSLEDVIYRGNKDLLWKQDFRKKYLQLNQTLTEVYRKRIAHNQRPGQDEKLFSEIFILEK